MAPFKAVTGPVVLVCTPTATPLTSTEKVHVVPAGSVAPDKVIRFVPATAVTVPPPQVPVRLLGVATSRPEGSVSEKAMVLRVMFPAGLPTVNVSAVVLLAPIS